VGTNDNIFANFGCDSDGPLRCVVQNTELLFTYAHVGFNGVWKCFPLYFVKLTVGFHKVERILN